MARKQKGTWDISIEINGDKVKNNLADIGKSIGKLRGQLRRLQPGTDEFVKKSEELKKARDRYKEINDEINQTNTSLEEARGHFSNLFTGLVSGDIKLVQSGLQGITGNIKGMTKAALAFIASPIGLAITALTGIALATKKFLDFNLQVFESNKLVKELTQTSGQAVDAIRIRAEVLQETFGVDFKESINSAKTLVNGFGISYDEAFDLIEQSAVTGKIKNEEFLESLKEYPIQFQNAGFSAKDFVNIVNTGIDLSIYKDKLPDALKEFTLSITEQTSAAKESMINAFGEQFTNRLFNNIKTGAITPKEALKTIALQAQNIGLNAQQAQALTADLFRGAGEDAGGALKIFEAVNTALSGQKKPLTENQKLTEEQLELNKELKGVYTQLFASSNSAFSNLIAKGKIFGTEILLKILKGGVDVYNWFVDLNNESGVFSAILSTVGNVASTSFKVIGSILSNAVTGFKGLGTIIEGIFTLDTDKIANGFRTAISAIPNLVKEIKNEVVSDVNDIYDAFQGKNKAKKIDLKTLVSSDNTTLDKSPTNNNNKDLTPEDKRIIDSKKKLAKFIEQWNKDQALKKAISDEEKEALEIANKEAEIEKKILDAEGDVELTTQLEEIKQVEVQAIKDKWAQIRLDKEAKQKEDLLNLEEKYRKKALKAEQDLQNAKINIKHAGLSALQNFFGRENALYKIAFGLQKALAVNEVLINTKKANAQIVANLGIANLKSIAASPLTGGMPMVAYNTSLATKHKLTNTLNAGAQIAGILSTTFFKGGYTGNKPIAYDKYGPIVGGVHEDEWVAPAIMTKNPTYAANFAFLENERKRLTQGSYYNGGFTDKNNAAPEVIDNPIAESQDITSNSLLIAAFHRNSDILEKLYEEGVTAVLSNDLRGIKRLRDRLNDLNDLENKNKR